MLRKLFPSVDKFYEKLRLSVGNNVLSPDAMAILVDALKEHAASKGIRFHCPVLAAKDSDFSELENFLKTLEANKHKYPDGTHFQYLFNYTVDSSDSRLKPHWTTANVHIVDGKIKFFLLDTANLIDGFIIQFALIDKYCPEAEITASHLKIQEDMENCGHFSLDHAMGLEKITDLPSKLDSLCGCDVFFMSPPSESECLISDQNHLYLYQDKKQNTFYRYQVEGRNYDFPLPYSIDSSLFKQQEKAPRRCENDKLCHAVLKTTSERGHTLNYTNKEKKDYYKYMSTEEVCSRLNSAEERPHLWNALRKLKYIPSKSLLKTPGFGSLFKNAPKALDARNVKRRGGKSLERYIKDHQKPFELPPEGLDDDVYIVMKNFAIKEKAEKAKNRGKTHLGKMNDSHYQEVIEDRQGLKLLNELANPHQAKENVTMRVKKTENPVFISGPTGVATAISAGFLLLKNTKSSEKTEDEKSFPSLNQEHVKK